MNVIDDGLEVSPSATVLTVKVYVLNSARLVNSIEVVLGKIFIMDLVSSGKAHIPSSSPVILVRDTV